MSSQKHLVLASTSQFRKGLMQNAGLQFDSMAPGIDERAIGDPMEQAGEDPGKIALTLAVEKAKAVSLHLPGSVVIGSDQTMALGNQMFHKPKDMSDARQHLLTLSGETHALHAAVAIMYNGDLLWSHVAIARMTMRALSDDEISHYLKKAGTDVLWSVGAYQIESIGLTLFEKIDGDYFTIMGLPMLPLLAALRDLEINHA